MKNRLFHKNLIVVLLLDALLLTAAWYASYLLRFNFEIPPDRMVGLKRILPLVVGLKIIIFYSFNLYKGM